MKLLVAFMIAAVVSFTASYFFDPIRPAPKPSPAILATSTVVPDPSPAADKTYAPKRRTYAKPPKSTQPPTPRPRPVWTPYNASCFADCFPDFTAEWSKRVDDYYFDTLDKPIPPAPLDHYACEYMHIAGHLPGIAQCENLL